MHVFCRLLIFDCSARVDRVLEPAVVCTGKMLCSSIEAIVGFCSIVITAKRIFFVCRLVCFRSFPHDHFV